MKNSIKIFGALIIVFVLFSCGKDADPVLEIYVSAKKSELYQSISMKHADIRMFSGENGGSTIQQYDGLNVDLDLTTEDNSVFAGNESHWEGIYSGMSAYLGNIEVITIDGVTLKANTLINASQMKFGGDFELVNNMSYRIDFIYDVDASVKILETENVFETVVEVKITQL